jgi:prepilin-type N-terminal cleavage/methylation domain-containing protein
MARLCDAPSRMAGGDARAPARVPRGFTLVEVVVALLLFAIGAAALAQTLVVAQQQRASTGRWLHAVTLAEERLELLRAGARDDDAAPLGEFTRRWSSVAVAPGLERVEVTVHWQDRGPQVFALTALRRTGR